MPTELPSLQPLSVLNAAYMVCSGLGLAFGLMLWRDVRKDWRALDKDPRPDPRDRQLIDNDLRRERWRFFKHAVVFIAIWLPLVIRPVLRDHPDPFLYELYRGFFAAIGIGLLYNSYADLGFRKRFRNDLARDYAG